jgi:hypothetical protein
MSQPCLLSSIVLLTPSGNFLGDRIPRRNRALGKHPAVLTDHFLLRLSKKVGFFFLLGGWL